MKLYITDPSPYARKCRIVLRERGLIDGCEEIRVDPYASDPALVTANPVAQVPSLVTDEGTVINDSPLICAWLDARGRSGSHLIPAGDSQWPVRSLEALADAGLEMGVKWVLEKRRPEAERSPTWIARWQTGLGRVLDQLEAQGLRADPLDLGVITTGVLVSWLDFRHPEYDWKNGRPSLEILQSDLEARPSFAATTPR
ncbi:MAG: glutathione S-transferase N-terminal domain-containing protein [Caulobacterales bacterium]|nr:glutathione S-transferase N-terminal domain-containing protein [Caulobacterales bacterium]